MIKPIEYEAVNWVDGMKITQKHFEAHTNFILDGLRDTRALSHTEFTYGLLPWDTKKRDQAIFDVFPSLTGDMELVVKNCHAVTPAGFRIALTDFRTNLKALLPQVGDVTTQQKVAYYVLLSVDPFDKVPSGSLDAGETPPRYPYAKSRYYLELMPVVSLDRYGLESGGNFIVLSKVLIQGNTMETDGAFIPPCTSILSHPTLLQHYNNTATTLPMLQQYAVKISQKALKEKQNTHLTSNVKWLCQVLIHDIGSVYYHFRNVVPHVSPLYFVGCFAQLAIHLHQVTQCISPVDLEEMLNYIQEWSEITPHAFLQQLTTVAEIKYDHVDCGVHIQEILLLLLNLEKSLGKLSELDYIGQRKENIIVNEVAVTPLPKANRGWSVLD